MDVAVVNGSLHGYEIKSAADTLERLPAQLATYCSVLDRATLVCAAPRPKTPQETTGSIVDLSVEVDYLLPKLDEE